jgi:uncharacterized membrane protein
MPTSRIRGDMFAHFVNKGSPQSKRESSSREPLTEDAVHILRRIEQEGGQIGMKELVDATKLPLVVTLRIVQQLSDDEFLRIDILNGEEIAVLTTLGSRLAKYA